MSPHREATLRKVRSLPIFSIMSAEQKSSAQLQLSSYQFACSLTKPIHKRCTYCQRPAARWCQPAFSHICKSLVCFSSACLGSAYTLQKDCAKYSLLFFVIYDFLCAVVLFLFGFCKSLRTQMSRLHRSAVWKQSGPSREVYSSCFSSLDGWRDLLR